jgi:gliding motility-associated-like protein
LRIQAQPGFANYSWNGKSTTVNYLDVTAPGTYTLIVTTADGCVAKTTFEVTAWCKQIIVRNTFTPNGDGINDFWEIGGVEDDATATVQIYNRYGIMLIDKKAEGYKWDGTFNGKVLPTGTYYYKISTKNSTTPLTGWVAIIR